MLSRSFTLGAVWTPVEVAGLRVSLDYTNTETSRDPFIFPGDANFTMYGDPTFFVGYADQFPGRVTRAPLTASDAANGYTAGRILRIDGGASGTGKSLLNAIDIDVAYQRETNWGTFTFSAQTSWILTYRRRTQAADASYRVAGYFDGPLSAKGNIGLTWARGAFGAGTTAEIFSSYRTQLAPQQLGGDLEQYTAYLNSALPAVQGKDRIPGRANVNAFVTYRFDRPGDNTIEFRLTGKHLIGAEEAYVPVFNTSRYGDFGLGYNYYGDPRGRQFALTISASF